MSRKTRLQRNGHEVCLRTRAMRNRVRNLEVRKLNRCTSRVGRSIQDAEDGVDAGNAGDPGLAPSPAVEDERLGAPNLDRCGSQVDPRRYVQVCCSRRWDGRGVDLVDQVRDVSSRDRHETRVVDGAVANVSNPVAIGICLVVRKRDAIVVEIECPVSVAVEVLADAETDAGGVKGDGQHGGIFFRRRTIVLCRNAVIEDSVRGGDLRVRVSTRVVAVAFGDESCPGTRGARRTLDVVDDRHERRRVGPVDLGRRWGDLVDRIEGWRSFGERCSDRTH